MKKVFLILSLITLAVAGSAPAVLAAEENIVYLGNTEIPYEERLDFVSAVKDILTGFNDRISDLEGLKADPYTTLYSTLKQKRDAIEYQLEYVDTLEPGEWDSTRDEIVGRVNELASDLHNLPSVSQAYRMQLPVLMAMNVD